MHHKIQITTLKTNTQNDHVITPHTALAFVSSNMGELSPPLTGSGETSFDILHPFDYRPEIFRKKTCINRTLKLVAFPHLYNANDVHLPSQLIPRLLVIDPTFVQNPRFPNQLTDNPDNFDIAKMVAVVIETGAADHCDLMKEGGKIINTHLVKVRCCRNGGYNENRHDHDTTNSFSYRKQAQCGWLLEMCVIFERMVCTHVLEKVGVVYHKQQITPPKRQESKTILNHCFSLTYTNIHTHTHHTARAE